LYVKSEPNNARRKIDEIETFLINDAKIDIICLSETWLNDQISDSTVDINGYSIRRKDRPDHRACGAAIYITDALPHHRALELELSDIDLPWIELQLGKKKILVGAAYRPPGQSAEEVELFMSNFHDSFELAFQSKPE
jgi:exonuclease III